MGGATLSFLNLIKGVKNAGITPVIVCPSGIDDNFILEIKKENYEYYSVDLVPFMENTPVNRLRFYRFQRKWLIRSMKELLRIVWKVKPDIIHTNTGVEHEGFWCSKLLGIPHVWHLREYQDKDFNIAIMPSKKIFCKMLKHSWSISITHDIQNHFGLATYKRACTIYNGILREDQITYNSYKEKFFISACRISREKGIDETIKAFAEFSKTITEYRLLIFGFGDSNYINELKSLCKELSCEDTVFFEGYKPLYEVAQFMSRAKALIVSSKFEGFGRMTAEAILSGCVVIGRNTGGTKEIISQTGGYMFSNHKELVQSMIDVANLNSQEYNVSISQAQNIARNLFTCEQNIKNTLALYNKIVSS